MIGNNCVVIFFILAVSVFGCGQKPNTANAKVDVKVRIDSLLNEQFKEGKLNGNVLVIQGEKVIYEKSFGFADGSKIELLNKDFRFNIGSIYKEFPAVAIMQLEEKKLLSLDDKISKYLVKLPEWSRQISIKHLLRYSSGLPKIKWDEYFSKGKSINDEDIMNDLQNIKKLEFEPGTDYLYTNYSPILLMKIVEKITKQKFGDYAKENLFDSFGLENTIIKSEYPYKDKTLMAMPFDSEFKEDDYKLNVSAILFSSTTKDLYHWFKQLDSFEVVEKQSLKFLSEKARTGDEIQSPMGNYIWRDGKIIEHSHHGSSGNFECVVRRFNDEKLTIVILTNRKNRNVYELSDKIRGIVKNN